VSAFERGSLIGSYRLLRPLGEGGMGEVWHAVDTMLEREAALKTLRPEMGARAELVERFRVEAIALARLHHRHIAAVYAFFEHGGRHHIAMQYVPGRTLEQVLQQRGRLPWREAAAMAADVLDALDHAHAVGVVHRDLKPANLMLDVRGRTVCTVVMDFGIARVMARARQTRSGTLVGTLEYIAPELVHGGDADARSDIYALGCVLYEAVSGRLPFEAASDFELMRAHAEQQAPRPTVAEGELPAALEGVILRMLDKRPERRYASARECLDALAAAVGDEALRRSTGSAPTIGAGFDRVAGSLSTASRDGLQAAAVAVRKRFARLASLRAPTHGLLRSALLGLDLPRGRDWPAWRSWLAGNPGLAGVAMVTCAALGLAASFSVMSVCCGAPEVVPPKSAAVVETPAAWTPPSRREPVAIDEPAPARIDTPRVVVVSSPDDAAAGRTTVRVEGGTARPAPKPAAPGVSTPAPVKPEAAAPEPESWYVRR
jgi:Protein kinase domain